MPRRPWIRVLLVVAGLLLALAGAAYGLLWTTAGSAFVVRTVLARTVGANRVTVLGISGRLAGALSFHGVTVHGFNGLPEGSSLTMERVHVAPAPRHLPRSWIEGFGILVQVPGVVTLASIGRLEGSLAHGLTLSDVELRGLPRVPPDTLINVQRLDITELWSPMGRPPAFAKASAGRRGAMAGWGGRLTPRQARVKITNGQLRLPDAEPILVFGSVQGERLDLSAYGRVVDPRQILELFPKVTWARAVSGTIRDVDAKISGPWREPTVGGTFQVERVTRRGFSILDAPGSAMLRFGVSPAPFQMHGNVQLTAGAVAARETVIRLEPSTITYSGNPKAPAFDVRGTASVKGTAIRITLQGTRYHPELQLTSVPPASQGRLLAMLATGQSWQGAEATLTAGQLSPDLAKDFIDYFVFGGRGGKLAERIGISDVSLRYKPETQTVGVGTTIGDRVELIYEAEQVWAEESAGPAEQAQEPRGLQAPSGYKVGAAYKVTPDTSVKVEGERAIIPQDPTVSAGTVSQQPGVGPHTRDEVYLKIERKF